MILFKRKQKPSDKLRDSFKSIAGEYMISQRWREHFDELFMEVDQYESQPRHMKSLPGGCSQSLNERRENEIW